MLLLIVYSVSIILSLILLKSIPVGFIGINLALFMFVGLNLLETKVNSD